MTPPLVFGDIQGCRDTFHRLLVKAAPSPDTPLWFTGDLINRGPDSLGMLREVIGFGSRALTVLGNHELHLLAVVAGAQRPRPGDTLNDILNAPDLDHLINWVRNCPLAHYENGVLMVHAGVVPQWDLHQTLACAHELESALRGPNWKTHMAQWHGSEPVLWADSLQGEARLRVIANAFTRIRFCSIAGEMELNAKGPPSAAPPGMMPWFEVAGRRTVDVTVVFGHWAALGLMMRKNLCALDSGCIWGRKLSAVRLTTDPHQRTVIQVDAQPDPDSSDSNTTQPATITARTRAGTS